MVEISALSPLSSLILLGILFYIILRVIQTAIEPGEGGPGAGARREMERPRPVLGPAAPPEDITLAPIVSADQSPFVKREGIDEIHDVLVNQNGMTFAGDFSLDEMPGFYVRAYTHPEYSLVAAVYIGPEEKMWTSLVTKYADGRVITTSSADEEMAATPRPRGMPLFNYPHLPIDQLFRRHKLETRPADKDEPVAPERFAKFFRENYSKLREGAMEDGRTGAITPIGSEAEPAPSRPFSPSQKQLREWLDRIYSSYPVPREKRRQFQKGLIWVSEDADMDSISGTISRYGGVRMDEAGKGRWVIKTEAGAEDIVEEGGLRGPALFDKINACLPAGKRFTRLPVSAGGVAFYNRMAPGA